MPYIDLVFAQAERSAERLSSFLRLFYFAVLLAVFLGLHRGPSFLIVMLPLSYGIVTLIGLWIVHKSTFRPWLSWVFATLDVALVMSFLWVLAGILGVPLVSALSRPPTALIFLFLINAAMRYRPGLVAYTACLFVGGWVVLYALYGEFERSMTGITTAAAHVETLPLASEGMRLAITVLAAITLAVIVNRSRRVLIATIIETHRKSNLSRYLPADLTAELSELEQFPKCKRQHAAVLFVDIRDFTGMSERLAPEDLFRFLTEFRQRMEGPIYTYGGTLDKFIGDAIMVVFGALEAKAEDARQALLCGLAMLAALDAWNAERAAHAQPPVHVGIGIHYGEVVAGALGDETRLEYTVIGDSVNIAQRIEELTRTFDAPMVVSADLLNAAGDAPAGVAWEALPPQAMRGRQQQICLYRLTSRN